MHSVQSRRLRVSKRVISFPDSAVALGKHCERFPTLIDDYFYGKQEGRRKEFSVVFNKFVEDSRGTVNDIAEADLKILEDRLRKSTPINDVATFKTAQKNINELGTVCLLEKVMHSLQMAIGCLSVSEDVDTEIAKIKKVLDQFILPLDKFSANFEELKRSKIGVFTLRLKLLDLKNSNEIRDLIAEAIVIRNAISTDNSIAVLDGFLNAADMLSALAQRNVGDEIRYKLYADSASKKSDELFKSLVHGVDFVASFGGRDPKNILPYVQLRIIATKMLVNASWFINFDTRDMWKNPGARLFRSIYQFLNDNRDPEEVSKDELIQYIRESRESANEVVTLQSMINLIEMLQSRCKEQVEGDEKRAQKNIMRLNIADITPVALQVYGGESRGDLSIKGLIDLILHIERCLCIIDYYPKLIQKFADAIAERIKILDEEKQKAEEQRKLNEAAEADRKAAEAKKRKEGAAAREAAKVQSAALSQNAEPPKPEVVIAKPIVYFSTLSSTIADSGKAYKNAVSSWAAEFTKVVDKINVGESVLSIDMVRVERFITALNSTKEDKSTLKHQKVMIEYGLLKGYMQANSEVVDVSAIKTELERAINLYMQLRDSLKGKNNESHVVEAMVSIKVTIEKFIEVIQSKTGQVLNLPKLLDLNESDPPVVVPVPEPAPVVVPEPVVALAAEAAPAPTLPRYNAAAKLFIPKAQFERQTREHVKTIVEAVLRKYPPDNGRTNNNEKIAGANIIIQRLKALNQLVTETSAAPELKRWVILLSFEQVSPHLATIRSIVYTGYTESCTESYRLREELGAVQTEFSALAMKFVPERYSASETTNAAIPASALQKMATIPS